MTALFRSESSVKQCKQIMWQCYIHLWQYSCFVQKNSAYIFSSPKSNLMDEVVSSVWLMIKSQLASGESLKILISTSHQVVCLLGQGVVTFLQPPHSTSLINITYHTFVDQYCVSCLKVREVIHLQSRIFDIVWKYKEVFDNLTITRETSIM